VKARELIISVPPNMRRKGSHRAGIACFQFGKRLKITLRRGVFVLCIPKGFESTQSLHPTPQNKVPDRSASELFYPRRERCTGAYARAELLVGGFQSRRNVDGVAMGCVVEEAPATKIADDRRSGMDANARDAQRDALFMTACAESLGVLVKSQCAGNRASGMVWLLAWGSKQHVQRIADDLRHRAVMGEHNICHAREVFIEQRSEDAGFQRLHKRGETGDVGKKGRNLAALPDEVDGIRVAGKLLDKVRREVARQRGIGPFGYCLTLTRVPQ